MEFKPLENIRRIEAIDALRGFALLGVLIANIPFAGENVITGKLDSLITFLWHFLIDKKFISIFSMLFGFGFYIQMKRAETRIVNFRRYFLFRMLLLFVIGSLHAFVIWNGDILRAYALGGILLMLVRNWPVKRLLIIAVLFSVILTSLFYIGNNFFGWQTYNYDYSLAKELPVTESYFRYFMVNAIMDPWVNFTKDMPITLVFTFGNMLIGFILARVDFFRLPQKLNNLTTILIIQGVTIGLASSFIYYKIISEDIELNQSLFWVPFVIVAGMISQSVMYVALFIQLYTHNSIKKVLQIFKFAGRLSLSNYILQSIFYLFVFFHCTRLFQLFGKLTIAETFLVAVLFFLLQSGLSYLWLRKNSQGPLEKIWKKFSYGIAKSKQTQKNVTDRIVKTVGLINPKNINAYKSDNYYKVERECENFRTHFSNTNSSTLRIRSIQRIINHKFVSGILNHKKMKRNYLINKQLNNFIMKTKVFLFAVLSLGIIFTSCQKDEFDVFPSSRVTTQSYPVSGINELEVSTVFKVYVSFSDSEESAYVEANENIHHLIKIEQDGDRLQVGLKNNSKITGEPTLNLFLKTSKLENVKVDGAGSVEFGNTLFANEMELELTGASRFSGAVVVEKLTSNLSGDSKVNITGSSDIFNISADGASEMTGFDFQTDELNANLKGASSVSLTVNQLLDVKANGASKVFYKGNGTIGNQHLSDASEIVKMD